MVWEEGSREAPPYPDWLQIMMEVTLHEATDQDLAIAKNLVPYYIYDMSEHLGWPCTLELQ